MDLNIVYLILNLWQNIKFKELYIDSQKVIVVAKKR